MAAEPGQTGEDVQTDKVSRTPQFCLSAQAALSFYRERFVQHQKQRGASIPTWRRPRNCADARYLVGVWAKRSLAARRQTENHLEKMRERTLHDFVVTSGNQAWKRAVREVQRPYNGTENWLLSCSASEGGWGRWVPNSQGSGVGGWLQFMPGTWAGFYRHAVSDVESRGFIVPNSSASWYSTLGQALAGAWAITHGMRHHWAGGGCWVN